MSRGGALGLDRVGKRYGALRAVDDVSLDVAPGEFVTLLGSSGSGKTTTLRIIAGFTSADHGSIVLDGHDLTRVPPYKRDIGMVFQNYALFPHMTAGENVAFPLQMRGVKKRDAQRQVEEVLELVHLDEFAGHYPRQLSGGQQQRVALARAIVFDPRLLLMDEPLGALDKKLREALQLEIMRISRDLGVTVVYVTHDQEEALVMSDRIAVYHRGRIEQLGTGEDLYERPASLFVAAFIGESNIFRGALSGDGLAWDGRLLRVARAGGAPANGSGAIVVRPERLRLRPASEAPADGENAVHGTLREVIYLGSVRRYVVELGGMAVQARIQAGEDVAPIQPGDGVVVSWPFEHGVLLAAGGEGEVVDAAEDGVPDPETD